MKPLIIFMVLFIFVTTISCSKKSRAEAELNLLQNENKKRMSTDFINPSIFQFNSPTSSDTSENDNKTVNALFANGL